MERPAWVPGGIDLDRPSAARVYDYFLGGAHNFAVDRDLAKQIAAMTPDIARTMRANREFLRRAVRFLVAAGIGQFLDIGSGIPTVGNVHEVAQKADPSARVLLTAGECIVRVPPKLMAHARDGTRTFGKSDSIDALAIAPATLREPDLPAARLDGADRDVRLLVDHRESLVAERTRVINRLRWHLHELDPSWEPGPRSLDRASAYDHIQARIAGVRAWWPDSPAPWLTTPEHSPPRLMSSPPRSPC